MTISDFEMDKKIKSHTENQHMDLPDTYKNMVLSKIDEGLSNKKKNVYMPKVAIAIIAFCLVCAAGGGVYAAVNYIGQRASQLTKEDMEQYVSDVNNSLAQADTFSRELTAEEAKRFENLENEYKEEGRFPEKSLLTISSINDIVLNRICFLAETSTFYLPDTTLSDEDILELIDFRYMRDYSIAHDENILSGTEEMGELEEIEEADAVNIATEMLCKLFDVDLNHIDVSTEYLREGDFSQVHVYIFDAVSNINYSIGIDLQTGLVGTIELAQQESRYADNIAFDEDVAKTQYDAAAQKMKLFCGEQQTIKKSWVEVRTKDSGFLEHGVINYCFELEDGTAVTISYSYSQNTFYQFIHFSSESFDARTQRIIQACEQNNCQYNTIEMK